MRLQRLLGHRTTLVAGASLSRFDSATIDARLCGWPFRSPAVAFRGSPQAVEEAMRQHRNRVVAAGPLFPAAPRP
jgi:hypothetical protein